MFWGHAGWSTWTSKFEQSSTIWKKQLQNCARLKPMATRSGWKTDNFAPSLGCHHKRLKKLPPQKFSTKTKNVQKKSTSAGAGWWFFFYQNVQNDTSKVHSTIISQVALINYTRNVNVFIRMHQPTPVGDKRDLEIVKTRKRSNLTSGQLFSADGLALNTNCRLTNTAHQESSWSNYQERSKSNTQYIICLFFSPQKCQ